MREIKINGIYKHFKGDYYIVEDVANHSETKEKYVKEAKGIFKNVIALKEEQIIDIPTRNKEERVKD